MNRTTKLSNVQTLSKRGRTVRGISLKANKEITGYLKKVLNYDGIDDLNIPGKLLKDLPDIINLSIGQVIDALGISKSTYYRARNIRHLDRETVDRMASLLKIYEKGIQAFNGDSEQFKAWLNTSIQNLGGRKPIELITSENGRISVLQALSRVRYNVYG